MSAAELRDLPDGRFVRYSGIVTLRQQLTLFDKPVIQ